MPLNLPASTPIPWNRANRPGFLFSRPLAISLLFLALAAGLPTPASEPAKINVFEMSGKALICELEKRFIYGTITNQETRLLANIYIFYSREMSKKEITPLEEETIYQSFKSTAEFFKQSPPEEKQAEIKAYRARCQ